MTIKDYNIVGSYNNQRVSSIDAERSVNVFEYNDALGKKPKSLINTSGLINTNFTFTSATGGFRAQFVFNNIEYVVVGSQIYSITTSGTVISIGTLANTSSGYVGVDANTFQIIFVDGRNGYIWDTIAQVFEPITDQSFPTNPIDVCTLDNFFVVANGTTNNFQLSSFDQGLVWGPAANNFTTAFATSTTNFVIGSSTLSGGAGGTQNYQTGVTVQVSNSGGTLPTTTPQIAPGTTYYAIFVDATHIKLATTYANAIAGTAITISADGTGTNTITSLGQLQQGSITSHPGTIVACRTLHRRLFLFSQFFTEVWENAGLGTNLPFRRINSLLLEYGTPAIGSISVGFDKMFFLSQDRDGLGAVMEVTGTESIPVSNRALDFQLAQYAAVQQVADCRSFLIKENGLIFYRMNFTAANHTFVYNVTLSDPSREETKLWHEEEVLNGDRHPAQTHAYFNGINYVGHYSSPTLYIVDSATFTNDGQQIRRMRIGRPIVPEGYQRIRIDRFQLDLLQGNIADEHIVFTDEIILTEDGINIETESGLDLLAEQQSEITQPSVPYVYLSLSRDGGQTYGYVIRAPMGNIGQRAFRTLWRKLGVIPRGQAFVPKIEFYDAVPFIVLGSAWAYEILPE